MVKILMEDKKNKLVYVKFSILTLLLVILDQYTKYLSVHNLKDNEAFVLIDGVFELRHLINYGAAGGIFEGQRLYFIIFTLIALPILIYGLFKIEFIKKTLKDDKRAIKRKTSLKMTIYEFSIILLISGAIGNLINRIVEGYVVDFIYFKLINFPIFNIADTYITISAMIILIVGLMFLDTKEFDMLFMKKSNILKEIKENNDDI